MRKIFSRLFSKKKIEINRKSYISHRKAMRLLKKFKIQYSKDLEKLAKSPAYILNKKVNRKVIPTSKAMKFLKKSMKQYSKVYEELST